MGLTANRTSFKSNQMCHRHGARVALKKCVLVRVVAYERPKKRDGRVKRLRCPTNKLSIPESSTREQWMKQHCRMISRKFGVTCAAISHVHRREACGDSHAVLADVLGHTAFRAWAPHDVNVGGVQSIGVVYCDLVGCGGGAFIAAVTCFPIPDMYRQVLQG